MEARVETAIRRDRGRRGGGDRESRNSQTPKLVLDGGSGLSLSSSTRSSSCCSFGQGTGCDKDWDPQSSAIGPREWLPSSPFSGPFGQLESSANL